MVFYLPLVFGIFMNAWSGNYVRKRAEERLLHPYTPLPDLIHDWFPKIPTLIPDLFLLICILQTLVSYPHLLQLERNVWTVGMCSILRSFSVCFTTMPTCMPKPSATPTAYAKLFLNTHDLMFSGHSLFFIGIGKMLNSVAIPLIGPFLLVVARQHYTIDVCVSGLVYFFMYNVYL